MFARTLTLALALSLSGVAHAGAKRIPKVDMTDSDAMLKTGKTLGFKTESKPRAYPKKVAIGYFAARYHFKETQAGKEVITTTTLRFEDEHYAHLTDELYAELVARLEAEGFEVVPLDQVTSAAAYQALEEKDEMSENGKRVRFAPSGMKNLPTFSSRPKKPGELAALNAELGTDAVVAAFVNIGLCSMDYTGKTGRAGTYACIKGDMTMPGFNISFYGGAKGSGDKTKPEWDARVFKEYTPFEYDKKENILFDAALISDWAAGRSVPRGFWKKAGFTGIEESFAGGAVEIYRDALAIGFEVWDKKNASGRDGAGMQRSELKIPGELEAAPNPAAQTAAATGEVPELPGEQRCYVGTALANGAPIGEVVVRYGIADDKVVEDSATLMDGQPPYRYVSTYAIDGSGFSVSEAKETWKGTGTFEEGWGAWSVELAMANGMTVKSSVTVDGETYTSTSNTSNGSTVNVDSKVEAKAVDADTCKERFAKIPVPDGAF